MRVARRQCGIRIRRRVQPPSQNPVAENQIEVVRRDVMPQVLQRIDDVAAASVSPPPSNWIDRPILTAREELLILLRIRGAAYKQDARNLRPPGELRQDALLENSAIFGMPLAGQAQCAPASMYDRAPQTLNTRDDGCNGHAEARR